jgi:cob(I)alamin adenosyltransferase
VAKDHPQIEAMGAFDELNVEIGAARLLAPEPAARELLKGVQASLVALMGELACAEEDAAGHAHSRFARLGEEDLRRLDEALAALEAKELKLDGWATPGATAVAIAFDRARVTARRAERRLAALSTQGRQLRPLLLQWTNRLSDLLWLYAREAESGAQ